MVLFCFGFGRSRQRHLTSLAKNLRPMDLKVQYTRDRYGNAEISLTDPSTFWPPPDPDRMPRSHKRPPSEKPFVYNEDLPMIQNSVDAFQRRQQEDLKRYDRGAPPSVPRRSLHERYRNRVYEDKSSNFQPIESNHFRGGEEGWQDSEGDRLDDFGVDEDADFYDQDDIPLADLIRRRNKSAVIRTSEDNSTAR